ncbi:MULTISPECIES: HAD family hydrolase [Hymenobacter]|uniref:phosphoglycolate phosphatase n=1 Tax=Hymenobacter mucosus TaxID=1411120 RepID=A0A238XF67_9BACT|nr:MULTISPECIES: HAD family hydrolase [Hymenobacter]SNR57248.1 phosphoglycolate phosphatase [Hymenobacter mucosus]
MPFSLLLFDYDGTLCDTRSAITHALRRTFQELNHPEPLAPILEGLVQRGLPLADTLRELHLPSTAPLPPEWLTTYRALYTAEAEALVTPFPGATETLAAAVDQGHTVVILSNKSLAILENSLRRLGLDSYASLVLGDDPTAQPVLPLKPDPALFTQRVQPRFPSVDLSEVLMIGDTTTDLRFAQNCGIASCWASFGFGVAADCAALHPTYRINSLSELLPLIADSAAHNA